MCKLAAEISAALSNQCNTLSSCKLTISQPALDAQVLEYFIVDPVHNVDFQVQDRKSVNSAAVPTPLPRAPTIVAE